MTRVSSFLVYGQILALHLKEEGAVLFDEQEF